MFEKKACTQVPIHELLARRWSPRALDADRDLDAGQLLALLEAARWAPSCGGAQPWRVLVFQRSVQPDAWQKVLEALSPGNADWAGHAPLLLVIAADMVRDNGKPNRWGMYDAGAAGENICLQATAMGLMAHQMGGFDPDVLRAALAVPEDCQLMAVIAIGFQLPVARIPEALREREQAPRERRPLGENFFCAQWGEPITRHLAASQADAAPARDRNAFQALRIAVLTVSDSRSAAEDRSGDLLCERLQASGHVLHERCLVADDIHCIRAVVSAWIAEPEVDVVLSTGGTGITGRDGTPDAIGVLLDKTLDGFGEFFRQVSAAAIATSTIQSRALAGVANGTCIFVLPGSPHACATAWDEIIAAQLDRRTRPCNLVQLIPRLREK